MSPELSIIVVNWNGRAVTDRCLESVRRFTEGIDYEVIVVDNGSTDGSAEDIERRFPEARMIRNGANLGFSRANNIGIRAASGRSILLLNNDTELRENAVKALYDFLWSDERIGACGGLLTYAGGSPQWSYGNYVALSRMLWITFSGLLRIPWGRRPNAVVPRSDEGAHPVEYIVGADLMVRREVLDEVGFLDERFFAYFEEADLCWRIREDGDEVWYTPSARVVHHIGDTFSEHKAPIYYTSLFRFIDKHGGSYRAVRRYLSAKHSLSAKRLAVGSPERRMSERQAQVISETCLDYPPGLEKREPPCTEN